MRLTVHLRHAPQHHGVTRKGQKKRMIKNTLTFPVETQDDIDHVLGELEKQQPTNIGKHYISNIN